MTFLPSLPMLFSLLSLYLQLALASPTLPRPVPVSGKPRLTFHPDGTFKITVFSDLHYGENPWDDWGPEQDFNSTRLMKRVLGDEKPDFVYVSSFMTFMGRVNDLSRVLNGDLITGESKYVQENSTSLIDEIVAPLNAAKIPFSSSHGNHDNQVNITHEEEILQNINTSNLITITDPSPALVLWFFDSRGGVSEGKNSTPLPDWVDSTVATWIESESKAMNTAWGPAETRGTLAFVHIPPHFVAALQDDLDSEKDPGLNADELDASGGSVQDSSSMEKDKPFYDALTKNVKNLHAIISGHDHGNEWCIREPSKDIIFCFDKHSGYGGYGEPGWGYGVRNIVFNSTNPNEGPETWIRLEEGDTRAKIVLNGAYGA
ncbi:Metallo-dependent phosphatase-like protein [Cyathus striatus]|nr:Metallo-dependent phosphatase-like protein [Cyathus striatus]